MSGHMRMADLDKRYWLRAVSIVLPNVGTAHNPSLIGIASMREIGQCHISFHRTCPSPSERRRQSPNGSPPPERVRDRRGRRGVEGEECGGLSAGGMAVAPPRCSTLRRQPPFKSEAHAGSADFDFLVGIPAAGTPAKKLVRIARMP